MKILVVGQLFDAHATLAGPDTRITVVDAAMEPTRTRDWVLAKVAIRERGIRLGLGKRRSSLQVLPWSEVSGLGLTDLSGQSQGAGQLLMLFDTMRAVDVAATCGTCRSSAGTRSPTRWTMSGSPTSSKNCQRTTKRNSWATCPRSAAPTSSRRWTRTTRPTCSPS
jgi:hypothetical protein